MTLLFNSRTTGAALTIAVGVCLYGFSLFPAVAEPVAEPAGESSDSGDGEVETTFTPEEREKLKKALSMVLNDPEVVASRNTARSAIETYKAKLREAVKRTSPELGEKVEKMLVERLTRGERDLFLIRFRSLFKPMKEIPKVLKEPSRELYAELSEDPEMERLRKESLKTQDVRGRSKIFGAMRARIAEIIEERNPDLFETLKPLPGLTPGGGGRGKRNN